MYKMIVIQIWAPFMQSVYGFDIAKPLATFVPQADTEISFNKQT